MSTLKIAYENLQASNAPFEAEIGKAVDRVLASGWFINGQSVASFERNFASYIGAKHCIGVANGLDALTLSLRAMEYPQGSDIRSEEHTSELQSQSTISYAVFCLKKKKQKQTKKRQKKN